MYRSMNTPMIVGGSTYQKGVMDDALIADSLKNRGWNIEQHEELKHRLLKHKNRIYLVLKLLASRNLAAMFRRSTRGQCH
jgi:hypothetical protein